MPWFVPPAGLSPAGIAGSVEFANPSVRVGQLTDAVNERTRELHSLFSTIHPVDAMMRDMLLVRRSSGPSVATIGNELHLISKNDVHAENDIRNEIAFSTRRMVAAQLVDIESITPSVDGDAAYPVIDYRNRMASKATDDRGQKK